MSQATGVYPLWLVPAILDETGEDDPMFVDLGVYGWCHRYICRISAPEIEHQAYHDGVPQTGLTIRARMRLCADLRSSPLTTEAFRWDTITLINMSQNKTKQNTLSPATLPLLEFDCRRSTPKHWCLMRSSTRCLHSSKNIIGRWAGCSKRKFCRSLKTTISGQGAATPFLGGVPRGFQKQQVLSLCKSTEWKVEVLTCGFSGVRQSEQRGQTEK